MPSWWESCVIKSKSMAKEKINWLLILQGWAMLWVVIGHSFVGEHLKGPEWESAITNFAYTFHMPLFMLVSGWLFYLTRLKAYKASGGYQLIVDGWTYWRIVQDKSLRLLLPGVVFSIISFAVKIAFPGEVSRQTGISLKEIVVAFLYPYDNPFRELWFIVALYWFFMLTPFWRFVLKRKWTMYGSVLLLGCLHFVHPETTLLSIDKVCLHALWFYLGILICKNDLVTKVFNKQLYLTMGIGIVMYLVRHYIPLFGTIGLILFSFGLALLADRFVPRLYSSFRNYTYQIFLMGIFAQMAVKIAYRHIEMPYVLAYLLCITMGLYVPVIVSKIIERINWKPLSLCIGLKTK